MADESTLHDPWLVAVWPGMGNVAAGAGGYLVVKLGAELVFEMEAHDFFDIQNVEVSNGLAQAGRRPRNLFFEWRHPEGGNDLLLFIGESQPSSNGFSFCHRILDYAQQRGVKRIVTFAALATQLHPSNDPRVFGIATENDELQVLRDLGVEILNEGQISGLNGVLLAAGAERNVPGICMLGELPFFAAGVPNPKASAAVLSAFTTLGRIELDFSDIIEQAEAVEEGLLKMLDKMKESAREQAEQIEENFDESEGDFPEHAAEGTDQEPAVDPSTRRRIEMLFDQANLDRNKAFLLKEELDRLGVYEHYENRFLDLFRKAE